MFFLFFWTLFFAAGRLIVAREVIVDDANGQISYTSLVDGLNWRPNHICQNCHGPLSVDALTREVVAAAQGGSWHTTRGGALQSNASLSFEGTRIAASFVAFKRDGQDVDPARVKECRVKFYIDNRLRQDTRLPWSDISAESRQAAPIFIPRLVLFDQPVEPGAHVFTIQHVCESTERDLVLALDSITYWTSDAESTAGPVAPSAASRKSNNAAIIAGSVVGGVAFIAILACALFWWIRRRRHWQHQQQLAVAVTNSSFGEPARANPWSQLSDIDELTEISNSQTSSPEITEVRPRPPSTAFSVKTLSTLSIFSRPGADLNGLPSPQAQGGRLSLRESLPALPAFRHPYGLPSRPSPAYNSGSFAAQR
ncbi:hypothetical protein BKA70DRAFT_1251499 [Coprinopsis sp. MPI-PUGE-AT-0042]|nr:hypothetical protein BKA70DRAFT_1251499 [Coprinopsis sp. MPI-PUGE-AT-0042]